MINTASIITYSALVLGDVVEIQQEDASAKYQVPALMSDVEQMPFAWLTPVALGDVPVHLITLSEIL